MARAGSVKSAKNGSGKSDALGELVRRLKFLLIAMVVYRLGAHIPVPGIDPSALERLFSQNSETILAVFNMFSGGALERMSVLALGIMPYISASIIMQLLTAVSPHLEQLKKEGEAGRRKTTQYTRYLTVGLALVQSFGMLVGLDRQGVTFTSGFEFYFIGVVTLVTGTMFLMWIGEQVTERGIGNGISMIIFAGIVAGLPVAIGSGFDMVSNQSLNFLTLVFFLALAVAIVAGIVFVERGQRRVTVNYSRNQGGRHALKQQSHLPLKVNMAGVIPPIFATSILLFPVSIATWIGDENSAFLNAFSVMFAPGQLAYAVTFSIAVMFFCFFYTAIVFSPREVSDNLKKSGAYLPGIRPGESTAKYIDQVLTRLTLIGGIYITVVCLVPQALQIGFDIPFYLGGTSLLIVVVVVMDFVAQLQAHMYSQHYEGYMGKSGLTNKR